jgi:hypothetical protein
MNAEVIKPPPPPPLLFFHLQGVDNHLFGLLMMAKSLGDSHAEAALEKGLDHSGFMMLSSHASAQRGPSGGFGTPQVLNRALIAP